MLIKGPACVAFYGMGFAVWGKSSRDNQVEVVGCMKKLQSAIVPRNLISPPCSFDPRVSVLYLSVVYTFLSLLCCHCCGLTHRMAEHH